MHRDDIREREYCAFVREINREPPPDDEYGALAARDAVTRAYGLNRYTAPHNGKGRPKAATAAHTGGIFYEGSREAARLCGKRRSSGANELSCLHGSERCEACDDEEVSHHAVGR